jgi:transposase
MANAATWAVRVAEWKASGLTAVEYCAKNGLAKTSLYWWSTQLKGPGRMKPEPMELARVVRVKPSEPPQGDGVVRVEVGGARLYIGEGVQRGTLVTILDALSECGQRVVR